MRVGSFFFGFKPAEVVFRENLEIKQMIYYLPWFQDTGNRNVPKVLLFFPKSHNFSSTSPQFSGGG